MTKKTEIIKCKCGAEAKQPQLKSIFKLEWYQVECTGCIKSVDAETEKEAIRLWNKAMQPEDIAKIFVDGANDSMAYRSGFDAGFNDGYAEAESEQDPTREELIDALEGVRMHKCMFDSDADFLAACEKVDKALEKAKGES